MSEQQVFKQLSPEVEGAGNIALALEMIFGWFGLLGIGHVYSGRVALGVVLLIGWWLYAGVSVLIATATLGIALCILVPIWIAAPVISGIQARSYARQAGETGSWGSVVAVGGIGCLLVIVVLVGLSILGIFASLAGAAAG